MSLRLFTSGQGLPAFRAGIAPIRYLSEAKPFTRKRLQPSPAEEKVVPMYEFSAKARDFLKIAKAAIEPMQEINPEFNIVTSPDKLVVDTPVSGRLTYFYNNESDTWMNSLDGHDVRGIITRDMLRQNLLGCPSF